VEEKTSKLETEINPNCFFAPLFLKVEEKIEMLSPHKK
jgi:hypothetical protein